jgi:hypothetical protein
MSRPARTHAALAVIVVSLLGLGLWFALRSHTDPDPDNPPSPVRFADVTEQAGIRFRHTNGMAGKKLLPETMGAGVAALDFDRDGRPDLFFVNSRPWPGQPGKATQALYRNRGDGTFEDVTASSGLDVELFGMGVSAADYDNDGWPDIFVTSVGGNKLFRNVGGKRFEDVTAAAGVGGPGSWPAVGAEEFPKISEPIPFPSSAAWLDYDNDGRLDLFVCYYLTWSPAADLGVQAVLPSGVRAYVPPTQFRAADCVLYRNVDGKRFEDVSEAAGVRVREGGEPVAKALGVCVCDPDSDGRPDVVVACDTTRNLFFHNVAAGGGRKFEEIGLRANAAYAEGRPRGGMGIDAAEILPDTLAVAIANFSHEPTTLLQVRRKNPFVFFHPGGPTGLAGPSRFPMKFGAMFFDADLDGRPDFFTANGHLEPDIASAGQTYAQPAQLFFNTGDPSKLWDEAAAARMGPDLFRPLVGRGCAYLDYDGDGDLDIVVTENGGPARLFRNDNSTGNNRVTFALAGGPGMNRDAIGAEVTVEAGGRTQRQYVTTARGYLSQSDTVVTFGLGPADKIDRVTVRWPTNPPRAQTWAGLAAGTRHTLAAKIE